MNFREAVRDLLQIGYTMRKGKGSHAVLRKGAKTIVLSMAATELSPGMAGKVRSHLAKAKRDS